MLISAFLYFPAFCSKLEGSEEQKMNPVAIKGDILWPNSLVDCEDGFPSLHGGSWNHCLPEMMANYIWKQIFSLESMHTCKTPSECGNCISYHLPSMGENMFLKQFS